MKTNDKKTAREFLIILVAVMVAWILGALVMFSYQWGQVYSFDETETVVQEYFR